MQNYQVYVNQLKDIGLEIYHNEFFEQLTIVLTLCIFFFLGRSSYEKKLTHLLQTVNDAETTRKKLTVKLEKENAGLKKIEAQKKILWVLLAVVGVVNAAIFYFLGKIVVMYVIYTVAPFLLIAILYFVLLRWSKWSRNKTQKLLKNTSITTETQIKQILRTFGPGLKDRLTKLYESEIESQWSKESRQQCKLYKCYNEKKSYEELYKLYEEIIDEIKKINMCDVCLSENNISVQKLGLQDLEAGIKNYRRARMGKLSLVQKKEMVNKLLAEYQKVGEKLPLICKKGCCIKQRVLIENAKAKYHERLKRTSSQLQSSIKKP